MIYISQNEPLTAGFTTFKFVVKKNNDKLDFFDTDKDEDILKLDTFEIDHSMYIIDDCNYTLSIFDYIPDEIKEDYYTYLYEKRWSKNYFKKVKVYKPEKKIYNDLRGVINYYNKNYIDDELKITYDENKRSINIFWHGTKESTYNYMKSARPLIKDYSYTINRELIFKGIGPDIDELEFNVFGCPTLKMIINVLYSFVNCNYDIIKTYGISFDCKNRRYTKDRRYKKKDNLFNLINS